MSAREDARDGALFLISGILAGVVHYGFQILASRQLSGAEFARLSGWLAHVSVGFVAAGLAQYAANFHPVSARSTRAWLTGANLSALLLAGAWLVSPEPLGVVTAGAIVGLAILYGWATGQTQIRLDFKGLAVAQLVNAGVKLLVPLVLVGGLFGYSFGIGVCFVPALWVLSWRLLRGPAVRATAAGGWTAPVVIALAANVIPQLDLILMQHTQAPPDFDAFARASLFYKGIYFFVFIFAQWLLPRQIRGGGPRWLGPGLVAGFAGLASVALALTAPLFAVHVFHWSESPARGLVLLSCLNMSLLTLLFVQIQSACAAGRVRPAILILAALALEALVQLSLAVPTLGYLTAAVVTQMVLVILALKLPSAPAA